MNADKSRSVMSKVVEHSRTKRQQGNTGRLATFTTIEKSNKLRYRQRKHKRENQESSWFDMSEDDDDDDDIDEM